MSKGSAIYDGISLPDVRCLKNSDVYSVIDVITATNQFEKHHLFLFLLSLLWVSVYARECARFRVA